MIKSHMIVLLHPSVTICNNITVALEFYLHSFFLVFLNSIWPTSKTRKTSIQQLCYFIVIECRFLLEFI
ncbi:hypothetical protein GCK32_021173 [Trichostrongylus colubriformis]|uniref:Uncharacterized protein n=1 Tax=Trichostrongylus colubriformis TaxID=6319 RepID=A0AAN8EQD1_TRICO